MYYFISDLHFGSINILKERLIFRNPDEMDLYLIEKWNNKVRRDDTVYIVGDLGGNYSIDLETRIANLNGKKILVQGNHDIQWLDSENVRLSKYFEKIENYLEVKLDGYYLTLCHYPLIEWDGSRRQHNSYMLHGHIHTRVGKTYNIIKEYEPRLLNCCPEINNYEPVTIEELIKNNASWYGRK